MTTNHLARETSPYLRQHARNPVDWYPWAEEAIAKARAEDRPIFLSIGYSSCHWCHVMAHESFEDAATASELNSHFVCIKVDREERPDLDALYMRAVMLTTGSGGWPLSVFLTPDLKPFFGGTYFPRESRWGMPSFRQVLQRVVRAYEDKRREVEGSADQLLRAVAESFAGGPEADAPDARAAEGARRAILERFDAADGGFGSGPKFPQPPLLHFLLDEAARTGQRSVAEKVLFTLRKMEAGGIRDQAGGGFHRYSVDGGWLVPHFEKMLYDNAQLASLYFRAFISSGDDVFRRAGEEVLGDLRSSMAAEGGGFIAALDADSEGEEGKFYLWTPQELAAVLGREEGRLVADLYGIADGPAHAERILHRTRPWAEAAQRAGQPEDEFTSRVRADLDRLREARKGRVHPGADLKVLTDWNALAASAFLDGHLATGSSGDLETGLATLDAVWKRCWDGQVLHHVWDGRAARVPGFLSDYAYLAGAEWRAFASTGGPAHMERSGRLLERALDRFRDGASGRLVDAPASGGAAGPLIAVRDTDDGVLPAPLSVLAQVLWHWERLTGEDWAREALDGLLKAEGGALMQNPGAQPLLAGLAAARSRPPVDLVVAGESLEATRPLLEAARRAAIAHVLVLPLLADKFTAGAADDIALFRGRRRETGAAAYVCVGGSCRLPVAQPRELERLLADAAGVI